MNKANEYSAAVLKASSIKPKDFTFNDFQGSDLRACVSSTGSLRLNIMMKGHGIQSIDIPLASLYDFLHWLRENYSDTYDLNSPGNGE
jgi:hypothetical protein